MGKKYRFIYLIISVIFILLQFFFYDIYYISYIRSLGLSLIVGFLYLIFHIIYFILIISTIVYIFFKLRTIKWKAFLPTSICIIVIFSSYIFPATNIYSDWNYNVNCENRLKTIEMIENKEMGMYAISSREFKTPFRETSDTGIIIMQQRGEVIKVLFVAHRGITISKIIVYVSDDSGIAENDFNFSFPEYNYTFSNINKLAPNWYSAAMKN